MEEKMFSGWSCILGNKELIFNTERTRKCASLYDIFLIKICELKGIEFSSKVCTEQNYKALKFKLFKVDVFDCGGYYSIRFDGGQANYPKTDCEDLIFF